MEAATADSGYGASGLAAAYGLTRRLRSDRVNPLALTFSDLTDLLTDLLMLARRVEEATSAADSCARFTVIFGNVNECKAKEHE